VRDEVKADKAAPVNVGRAVDLLTGKARRKGYTQPLAPRQPSWFQRRHRELGNLTGTQVVLVGVVAFLNLCLLLSLGALFLFNSL
jgi:hypothetical protein